MVFNITKTTNHILWLFFDAVHSAKIFQGKTQKIVINISSKLYLGSLNNSVFIMNKLYQKNFFRDSIYLWLNF